MKIGEYHSTWWKAFNILKQDGHLLFEGQEIQEGIRDEEIEVAYERLMSPLNNIFEMLIFFTIVHIRVVEDMVRKDIALFQKNWEQIDEEQGKVSLLDIRRYL
jgi:hypothetical protein